MNPNNSESEKGSAVCRPFFVVIKMVIVHAEHEENDFALESVFVI